jgi:hypothetical protein
MFTMRKIWQILPAAMLVALVAGPAMVWARPVDCGDALAAGNTFKDMVIQRDGGWGESPAAIIEGCQEFTQRGKLLGYFLPVAPKGYIIINPLTQLSPVKAYSTESDLDITKQGGFVKLLRDTMGAARTFLVKNYGPLQTIPDEVELAPRENRKTWDRLLGSTPAPDAAAGESVPASLLTVGPLLTSSWHQGAPYNNSCPLGYGGSRTAVGCVATAAAQIMKFWNYPANGIGSKTYTWDGDNSCTVQPTAGSSLSATFSDSYDWANMLDRVTTGSSIAQQAAVAGLSYEVGVAVSMDYGVCGSGAYLSAEAPIYSGYFNYATTTGYKYRSSYSTSNWFYLIKRELDAPLPRPIHYNIDQHSIVADGYRQDSATMMVHMNYGWDDSHNAWFDLDNLYCYWDADSICPASIDSMVTGIQPKNRLMVSHIGAGGQIYLGDWNHAGTSFSAGTIPGGGTSSDAPAMAVFQNKQYLAVKGTADNHIYIKSRTGRTSFADSSWTQLTGLTSASPALISFNNRLYLFVKGYADAQIYYCSLGTDGLWTPWGIVSGSSTLHKPALVVFNDRLYLFLTGGTNRILYDSMDPAERWSGWYLMPTGLSDRAPAVVNYNGGMLVFVKGVDNAPWYTGTSTPESPSSWVTWTKLDGLTPAAPSVAVVPETNQLHVAVAGASSSGIFHRYYNPSIPAWSGWEYMMGVDPDAYTEDTPALNTYYRYDEPH